MVRLEPNPSFFAASCWSVLVVNGGDGFLRRSRRLTSVTGNAPTIRLVPVPRSRRRNSGGHPLHLGDDLPRVGVLSDLRLLAVDVMELRREPLPVLLELRLDGPVFHRLERADLALALDDAAAARRSARDPRRFLS